MAYYGRVGGKSYSTQKDCCNAGDQVRVGTVHTAFT